jgi:hypothetical protein
MGVTFRSAGSQKNVSEGTAIYTCSLDLDGQEYSVMALASGNGPAGLGPRAANSLISGFSELFGSDELARVTIADWKQAVAKLLRETNRRILAVEDGVGAPIIVSSVLVLISPDKKLSIISAGAALSLIKVGSEVYKGNVLGNCEESGDDGEKSIYASDREIIVSALGVSETPRIRASSVMLKPGSSVYLLSDGFLRFKDDVITLIRDTSDSLIAPFSAIDLIEQKRGISCGDAVLLAQIGGDAD